MCRHPPAPTLFPYTTLFRSCSGFLYSLTIAAQFIANGTARKVVVVGADKMSSIIDYKDRATCVLFGDGAGAVLLDRKSTRLNSSHLGISYAVFCLKKKNKKR